jgi:hypothetical protein
MKNPLPTSRFLTRVLTAFAAPLLLAFTLAFTGCATRTEVAEIVARSNAAMLAGQFGLPSPTATGHEPAWQTESDRIESFIAAHPGQETITAPLRNRQAMLLLTHGQFSLAEAAFNQVQETNLLTPRDQALKRTQETLLWWFASSTKSSWTASDWKHYTNSLERLKEEQARLAESPEIRDYLAEMRAWIGLAAARHSTAGDTMRTRLEEALNAYAETFTEADLYILAGGADVQPGSKTLPDEVRRRLRAKAVLDSARELNQKRKLGAQLKEPVFQDLIN